MATITEDGKRIVLGWYNPQRPDLPGRGTGGDRDAAGASPG
jgi:hypothetical protein